MVAGLMAQKTYLKNLRQRSKGQKILDALKKEYDGYKSMEVNFELVLELKAQAAETQRENWFNREKIFCQ